MFHMYTCLPSQVSPWRPKSRGNSSSLRSAASLAPFLAKFSNVTRALVGHSGKLDETYREWHRKYGPVVRVGPNVVSISDPSMIRVVYATKKAWVKSPMYRPNDVLLNGKRMSNVFNTSDKEWHDKYMKPIRGLWTITRVLDLEPFVHETVAKFTDKLAAKFVDGKVCMMDDWLTLFAWDVTANLSFGRHYGFLDEEKDVDNLITDSTNGLYYFATVSQIPWLDHFLDKNSIVRIGSKHTLTGVLYAFRIVAEYRQALEAKETGAESDGDKSRPKHFLAKYMALQSKKPDLINDAQVVNYIMLNVLAGGDTTAATLRTAVYYLAQPSNKAFQDGLAAELRTAGYFSAANPLTYSALAQVRHLDALYRESIRYGPGIAYNFERVVSPGPPVPLPDGHVLPPGTFAGINPGVTGRNKDIFGDAADLFRPERWFRQESESESDFAARARRMRDVADSTFGAGNRVCMGRDLARVEIFKALAALYSQFEIKLVDPNHKWHRHNAWLVYQTDMPMLVTRRERE